MRAFPLIASGAILMASTALSLPARAVDVHSVVTNAVQNARTNAIQNARPQISIQRPTVNVPQAAVGTSNVMQGLQSSRNSSIQRFRGKAGGVSSLKYSGKYSTLPPGIKPPDINKFRPGFGQAPDGQHAVQASGGGTLTTNIGSGAGVTPEAPQSPAPGGGSISTSSFQAVAPDTGPTRADATPTDAHTPPFVCAALQRNASAPPTWLNGNCQYTESAGATGTWTYDGNGRWTLAGVGDSATVTFRRAGGIWYQTVEERTAWGMQTTYRRMGDDGAWTPVDAIPGIITASGGPAGSSPAPLRWRHPAVRPAAALPPRVQAYAVSQAAEPRLPATPAQNNANNAGTPNQTDNGFKDEFANLDEYMTYITDLPEDQKAVFLVKSVEIFDQLSNEQKQVICRGLPDVIRSILSSTPGGGCRSAGF